MNLTPTPLSGDLAFYEPHPSRLLSVPSPESDLSFSMNLTPTPLLKERGYLIDNIPITPFS
jgi:hypothetical protein